MAKRKIAKKKKDDVPAETPAVETSRRTVSTHYGIEHFGGSVDYHAIAPEQVKARTLIHGSRHVEHVSDDGDGVWIYRHLG